MKIIVADAETFWSPTHSLSKMNPVAYVMHPETELISMAVKEGNTPTKVIFGEDAIQAWADSVDWSDVMLVGHNMSGFDSMIFAWRLGVNPKMWACTLAMAKPLHGITVGGSLGKLVEHYGLGVKDQTVLHNTKGRHLKDFTPEEVRQMAIYNAADTDQTCALFFKLLPQTSKDEMRLIDMTVRMLVEPQFDVNTELLEKTLLEERERKLESLLRVAEFIGAVQPGMTEAEIAEAAKKTLASQPKFAAFLESRGVEVPMKQSPSNPDKQTYALAKTDEGFIALQEHEDPLVAAAAIARLGVKSTILETRIQTFLEMAENCDGYMPIALIYYGAQTGRWGGCLVADTRVLVYECITRSVLEKQIIDVMPDDLVWDGEEFVGHEGVAFSGYSEVITWDGITGTEDHNVFTDEGEISLRDAMKRQVPVTTCRRPTKDDVDAAGIYARYHKGRYPS